jgi:hypothetical protein
MIAFAPDHSNKCFFNCFISSILICLNIPGFLTIYLAASVDVTSCLSNCTPCNYSTFKCWTWIMLDNCTGRGSNPGGRGDPAGEDRQPRRGRKVGSRGHSRLLLFHETNENVQDRIQSKNMGVLKVTCHFCGPSPCPQTNNYTI